MSQPVTLNRKVELFTWLIFFVFTLLFLAASLLVETSALAVGEFSMGVLKAYPSSITAALLTVVAIAWLLIRGKLMFSSSQT